MDESPTKEGPARAWLWTAVAPSFAVFAIWMLIGSIATRYRAADLFTLVSRALDCDLDVFIDLKDVLDKLLAGCSDDRSLRPDVLLSVEKVIPDRTGCGAAGRISPLENLRFSRVLRTRYRLVRSGRHFIHSLLRSRIPRRCARTAKTSGSIAL